MHKLQRAYARYDASLLLVTKLHQRRLNTSNSERTCIGAGFAHTMLPQIFRAPISMQVSGKYCVCSLLSMKTVSDASRVGNNTSIALHPPLVELFTCETDGGGVTVRELSGTPRIFFRPW